MSVEFNYDTKLGQALANWWLELKDDAAARAELRRCGDVDEVMMTATFQRLFQRKLLTLKGELLIREDRMASVVGLLSHLHFDVQSTVLAKNDHPVEAFVAQMASPVSGDRPLISELRFRRLLQEESADLYPKMIRVIRMLKGAANLYGLANSVYFWGDNVKKRWAYAYFPSVPKRKSA